MPRFRSYKVYLKTEEVGNDFLKRNIEPTYNKIEIILELRAQIIRTAGEMFFNYGLRSVSVDDICREMRISKKTFYTQFKLKEDLVVELLKRMHEQKQAERHNVCNCDNVIDFCLQNFTVFTKKEDEEKFAALFFDLEKFYPKIWGLYHAKMQEDSILYTSLLLKCGVEQGWFRNDMNIDAMSVLIAKGFKNILLAMRDKSKKQINKQFMLDTFMHMVATPEGLAYYKEKTSQMK